MYFEFDSTHTNRNTRLAEWSARSGYAYLISDGLLWVNQNNIVQPLVPYSESIDLTEGKSKEILESLDGGVIKWTQKPESAKKLLPDPWYIAFHDPLLSFEDLAKETRKSIDIGTNNSIIKRIDAKEVMTAGFAIYQKAIKKANNSIAFEYDVEEGRFLDQLLVDNDFDDLIHYFGVYHDNRLVGFSRCLVFSESEAHIMYCIVDPDYEVYKLKYAIVWYMLSYYLHLNTYKLVICCQGPLTPDSFEEKFYIHELRFQKQPMFLQVLFRRDINYKLTFMKPFNKLIRRWDKRFQSYMHLDKHKQK